MSRENVSFDPEVFSKTASLFATKRSAFAAEAVEALARDIVQRLADARAYQAPVTPQEVPPDRIAEFCGVLIEPGPQAALRFIAARRAEGVTRQDVYLGYISGAARHLGKCWERDELSFVQVTIGTGHLYALMRALRSESPNYSLRGFDARRSALFATVPGEDHGIGITVAADLFREAGWDIDLHTGTDHRALLAQVERTEPHVIGLSLSTEDRLNALVRLVVAMRLIVPQAIIGVAAASEVDAQRVKDLVDIDLMFHDAESARLDLESRLFLSP